MSDNVYDPGYVEVSLGVDSLEHFENWAFGMTLTPLHGSVPSRWFNAIVDKWNTRHPEMKVFDVVNRYNVLDAMINAYKVRQ